MPKVYITYMVNFCLSLKRGVALFPVYHNEFPLAYAIKLLLSKLYDDLIG